MKELINEILEHLFEGYTQSGGTKIFDVGQIITARNENTYSVGKHLVDNGWVKNQLFHPTTFAAGISMHGIQKIRPGYINDNVMHVLRTLSQAPNSSFSLMEILQFEPKDFQIAHDFACLMRDNNLVDARFGHNDIAVQITIDGRNFLEGN